MARQTYGFVHGLEIKKVIKPRVGGVMLKQLYMMSEGKPILMSIRNYTADDVEQLIEVQRQAFPPPFPEELWWNKEQLQAHIDRFPQGALCAEVDGQLVGSMTGLIVDWQSYGNRHSWEQITDSGYIGNHNPRGDTLYNVDICIVPSFRKSGAGKWLMQSMYETVVQLQLKKLMGGARMPGFAAKHAETGCTPEQYVEHIVSGVWKDPVVTFLLRCGRMPYHIAYEYLDDEESANLALLMEWKNPFIHG